MRRAYSTKRWRPIPKEFETFFIANGWTRSNLTFGKRETLRYVTALGRSTLRQKRDAFLRGDGGVDQMAEA
jgi:hypothetical protein